MKRIFFILSLAMVLSGIFNVVPFGRIYAELRSASLRLGLGANLVFANQHPCKLESAPGAAIPDTFSVGDCLVAPGQEGSKFVPQKDQDQSGESPVEKPVTIASAVVEAIDLLVKLIASLALIVFILGALLAITSEGKEDRLEKGKSAMLYAIIGLIVAGFSFIIVTFVQSVLF